jgi:hypothetical protein
MDVIKTTGIDNGMNGKCGDRRIKVFFFGLGLLRISSLAPVCDSDKCVER